MAGTERLKRTAMFVPIEEGFQRKSNHSQKESRCQTKEEHESRGGESFPMCALNPQRSTATSARWVQHRARGEDLVCGSAASLPPCHENETLRSRQNQRSASVNLPKHLAGAIPTFSWAGPIFQEH